MTAPAQEELHEFHIYRSKRKPMIVKGYPLASIEWDIGPFKQFHVSYTGRYRATLILSEDNILVYHEERQGGLEPGDERRHEWTLSRNEYWGVHSVPEEALGEAIVIALLTEADSVRPDLHLKDMLRNKAAA